MVTNDRLDELKKELALISQRIQKLEKAYILREKKMNKVNEENAIIDVKGKDKQGHLILGKKRPMESK